MERKAQEAQRMREDREYNKRMAEDYNRSENSAYSEEMRQYYRWKKEEAEEKANP